MTNNPLISILMVTYNSGRFVRESLNSVLKPSYANFEVVVVDDNSTDNTWEIISSYDDVRLRRFRNVKNLGEYANRNYAVSLAKGEYSIFIDGDDLLYPFGLQFLAQFSERYSDCAMIISRQWNERIIYPKRITPHQFYCFEYLDNGISGINFTKILFKTSVLREKPFPANVKLGDVYIQHLIARGHSSVIIPDAATWWRRNPGQASERLLNNYTFYLTHELWIKLEMIGDKDCPLNAAEKHRAYINIFGNLLRYGAKQIFRLKVGDVYNLFTRYPVPFRYLLSFFIPQQRRYFNEITGSNPLQDVD